MSTFNLLVFSWYTSVAACSFSYVSGPFTIVYDDARTPTLRVYTNASDNRTVWYTSASNGTFVTAARVLETVQQNGGTFVFDTSVQEVCVDMEIKRNGTRRLNGTYPQVDLLLHACWTRGII